MIFETKWISDLTQINNDWGKDKEKRFSMIPVFKLYLQMVYWCLQSKKLQIVEDIIDPPPSDATASII